MDSYMLLDELYEKWHIEPRYKGLLRFKFTDWVMWKDRLSLDNIKQVGVYALAKYQNEKEAPALVDPLDKNIIYFGKTNTRKSTSFKNRLNQFEKEAFGNGGCHSGGSNYKHIYGKDTQNLYLSICPLSLNATDIVDVESSKILVKVLITRLETCLRGMYVYMWGVLPRCNKE